jgi:hypothetical protein
VEQIQATSISLPRIFHVFIPIGCSMQPGTDTPYADTGVVPDICVPPAAALDQAHREALTTVLERIGDTPTDALAALDAARRAESTLQPSATLRRMRLDRSHKLQPANPWFCYWHVS